MGFKDPQVRKLYHQKWQRDHAEEVRKQHREYAVEIKLEVLSHYGPSGSLQCSWPDCTITDPDMLTLDHVDNDGASHRKMKPGLTGHKLYSLLRSSGFPAGYQTLCWNHNSKKEIMRRKEMAN